MLFYPTFLANWTNEIIIFTCCQTLRFPLFR